MPFHKKTSLEILLRATPIRVISRPAHLPQRDRRVHGRGGCRLDRDGLEYIEYQPAAGGDRRKAMYPEDVDPESGCRQPLPRRDQLDDAGQRTYDSLADPKGGTITGVEGARRYPAPQSRTLATCPPLNRYLRHEAGLGGRVRELAILTTARELDSQFEWAAHEPEALGEGISREVIEQSSTARTRVGWTRPTQSSSSWAAKSSARGRWRRLPSLSPCGISAAAPWSISSLL